MPSLKLSNPFRRGADRPSLRDRAASLKATAGRVMRRKPADHAGVPVGRIPVATMIRSEGKRLLDIADAEFDRLYAEQTAGLTYDRCDAVAERLNGELRLRALDIVADENDPAPPVAWHSPPEGFMAYPAIDPQGFININDGLGLEAERLHGIALAEFERRREGYRGGYAGRTEANWNAHLRRVLRLDELAAAASPERAEPAGNDRSEPGFVLYEDAGGTTHRKPVADWIGFTVQRLYGQARMEMARQLGDPALSDEDRAALAVKLRRDLRLDALGIAASRSLEAFDVAMAAEDEATRAPIPAPNVFPSGPISGDLHTVVEAHREARQMMIHDPIEDDARTAAHVERITALGDAVRKIPARTLADLRHKVIYLWPGALAGEVADDEVADTFRSFRQDVMGLVAQPFIPSSRDGLFPDASVVPANLDFSSLPLRTLEALHDHAVTLHSVAVGLQALPYSTHGKRGWLNHAGLFAAWLGEVAGWMEQSCKQGARDYRPTTTDEQSMRLQVLASTIVRNGDTDDMKDFAHDLLALAEA